MGGVDLLTGSTKNLMADGRPINFPVRNNYLCVIYDRLRS